MSTTLPSISAASSVNLQVYTHVCCVLMCMCVIYYTKDSESSGIIDKVPILVSCVTKRFGRKRMPLTPFGTPRQRVVH